MSSVLESTPPQFSADEAARIAADLFGFEGTATLLGSERDQAFLLQNGRSGAVLKISNTHEDETVLDLEDAAIAHAAAVDPDLPLARPLAPRATFNGHHVRLFERRNGHKAGPELDDAAVHDI
ncbi:MAG TPA: phosphotransferase, partial [Gaiellaceae bacterium]|nr:phosphotransferase [Gaiellaceae bacterium]